SPRPRCLPCPAAERQPTVSSPSTRTTCSPPGGSDRATTAASGGFLGGCAACHRRPWCRRCGRRVVVRPAYRERQPVRQLSLSARARRARLGHLDLPRRQFAERNRTLRRPSPSVDVEPTWREGRPSWQGPVWWADPVWWVGR